MFSKMLTGVLLFVLTATGCSSVHQPSKIAEEGQQGMGMSSLSTEKSVPVSETVLKKEVTIVNQKGESIGKVTLTEEKGGVGLRVEVAGLPPGKHGFHVHEKAFQDTNFKTAGEHFNPTNKEHGLKNPKGPHLGDMPNLIVDENGKAEQAFFLNKVTLREGSPFTLIGRSIIIHANPDDQISNPAGNSGERIAGGNITN